MGKLTIRQMAWLCGMFLVLVIFKSNAIAHGPLERLSSTTLEQIDIHNKLFREAVEDLAAEWRSQTGQQLVFDLGPGSDSSSRVSLVARNVTFLQALDLLCLQAGTSLVFGENGNIKFSKSFDLVCHVTRVLIIQPVNFLRIGLPVKPSLDELKNALEKSGIDMGKVEVGFLSEDRLACAGDPLEVELVQAFFSLLDRGYIVVPLGDGTKDICQREEWDATRNQPPVSDVPNADVHNDEVLEVLE